MENVRIAGWEICKALEGIYRLPKVISLGGISGCDLSSGRGFN